MIEANWNPLQELRDGVIEQDGFRAINDPTTFAGVVIHPSLDDGNTTIVRQQLEQWIASVCSADDKLSIAYEAQMNSETLHVPKRRFTLKVNELVAAKKWQRLFAQPKVLQTLRVTCATKDGVELGGATVQQPCFDDLPRGEGTTHLAFWIAADSSHGNDEELDARRRQLVDVVDRAFHDLHAFQAWVSHWDWAPRFSSADENEYTPYEEAYSVGSIGVEDWPCRCMMREWCETHLRAVAEDLWLGPSLMNLVSSISLEGVARTTRTGASSARLELLKSGSLNDLERHLRPILPWS